MYYVRKLSKPSSLFKLQTLANVNELCADFLGQDMRTSENTLSVWRSETLGSPDIDRAINAALLASSQVNTSQFLVIDFEALFAAGIRTDDTQPGKTGYKGLENLHTNLCDLTYEKIGKLIQIYRDVCQDKTRTPKIEKDSFKNVILNANKGGLLDISNLQGHMQQEIMSILELNRKV